MLKNFKMPGISTPWVAFYITTDVTGKRYNQKNSERLREKEDEFAKVTITVLFKSLNIYFNYTINLAEQFTICRWINAIPG